MIKYTVFNQSLDIKGYIFIFVQIVESGFRLHLDCYRWRNVINLVIRTRLAKSYLMQYDTSYFSSVIRHTYILYLIVRLIYKLYLKSTMHRYIHQGMIPPKCNNKLMIER